MNVKTEKSAVKGTRHGRKPMTPEQKAAAAEARAKEKAQANNLKPELVIQYQGTDTGMGVLVEAAKADFRKVKKRTLVTSLKIYYKPEEQAACYVINENYEGKLTLTI